MIRFVDIRIPESFLTDNRFSPMERLIGEYLFSHPDRISHREIVEAFRVSKNTVTKALDGFEKAGILIRESRVGGWRLSDEYVAVSNPKKWDDSPRNWDSSPRNWDSSPKNCDSSPTNWDSEPSGQEETESEKESKKERSKERSKEKEREKEEGVRENIGNPYGLPLSETDVSDAESARSETSLSDSEFLEDMEYAEVKQCPYQAIQNMFNRICISYPRVRGIDGKRRQLVSGRWTSYPDLEVFRQVFENAENSSFMKGQGRNGWTADFDWMMKPSNFQKVLEGNYNDRPQGAAGMPQQEGDPFLAYMRKVMNGEA